MVYVSFDPVFVWEKREQRNKCVFISVCLCSKICIKIKD